MKISGGDWSKGDAIALVALVAGILCVPGMPKLFHFDQTAAVQTPAVQTPAPPPRPCQSGCSFKVGKDNWQRTHREHSELSTFGHDIFDIDVVFQISNGEVIPKYLHVRGNSAPQDEELQYGMTRISSFSFSDSELPEVHADYSVEAQGWSSTGSVTGLLDYGGSSWKLRIEKSDLPDFAVVHVMPQ